jgi:hypothetical protein
MYLRDKAIIESNTEEKRKVIRRVKQQVEQLCCILPLALSQITGAFLEPHKARIFPEGRPASLAINGLACSGGVKRTTKEVLSNVVRSKHKAGPFTSTDGKYRNFTDDAAAKLKCRPCQETCG